MTEERFIEVRGLAKSFGAPIRGERGALGNRVGRSPAVKAVDAVSLDLAPSARLAVLGPSGCGKTTLLRLIAGLEVPDAGEILIRGKVVSRPGWALQPGRRGLGFVFQEPALWPHMTVAGNVLFGLHGLTKDVSRRRLGQLMELIGLQGDSRSRYPHQLSGGEARRVALARTLAPRPHCLLLDEPRPTWIPESKARMLDLINRAAQLSGAAIQST